MTSNLLSTKLFAPVPREKLVARPRLLGRLNAGLQKKLTLISAPAGFGKTTVLSTWIENSKYSIAWLSLDESDNDLTRFLSYFIAALQTLDTSLGRGAAVDLQSLDGVNTDILLMNLLDQITGVERVGNDHNNCHQPALRETSSMLELLDFFPG